MKQQESIQDLKAIRSLMERSSRFISLSGLSGVSAGIIALIGAGAAFFHLNYDTRYLDVNRYFEEKLYLDFPNSIKFLVLDGFLVLSLAILSAIFFTTRKAKKNGLKVWDHSAKNMLIHLAIPLVAGGIFCAILLFHKLIFLIAPATLIFYGLALINAAKFTYREIKWLGLSEIALGLFASLFAGYGLIVWALGFGVLHIAYGSIMYARHEK